MREKYQRFAKVYKNISLLLLNTIVVFLLVNGIVWFLLQGKTLSSVSLDEQADLVRLGSLNYDFNKLKLVYPELEDKQIIRLLLENWNIPLVCDRDTFFREQSYHGTYVNVDQVGFRAVKEQEQWPPLPDTYNIFVFGGSTTFGYGEMDNRSIPSFLQKELRARMGDDVDVAVYNFGHGYYFSLQERLEFERLIGEGYVPDLAIFIDGLNDFYYWNGETENLPCNETQDVLNRLRNTLLCHNDELCWPIQRLMTDYGMEFNNQEVVKSDIEEPAPPNDDLTTNMMIINRWLDNKGMIEELAREHNVQTLFVLQPVPSFEYDLANHLFIDDLDELGPHARAHWGYPVWIDMAAEDSNKEWSYNFVNLAYMTNRKQEPLFVDKVHYTAPFANQIAWNLVEFIINQEIVQPDHTVIE